ncbi:sigma 54-interacting response regulator [Mucilaginibacter sp. KACC 22773]|uniref:sigma 54-interacting response regulator n=1 Tax=Mucilaginibacter sp. KACC 22773 TaxID=3025671 RepID=UPI002366C190|nr:sigma 54-interacting response regulator [Mucilaginibacter sp. KACC 22773]WDF79031.1 sigma 54-interacting response regulator [Mucilaginibacter sp. KACC 22773]
MDGKILIVEDEFIIASDLRIILEGAGYEIAGIAPSVAKALEIINLKRPVWVFLDIYLSGTLTGIDLAKHLVEMNIPFVYVSANSNQSILEAAKATKPYGFLVKPFREKDVLVTFDIAKYRYEHDIESKILSEIKLQDEVVKILADTGTKEDKGVKIVSAILSQIPFDFFYVSWTDPKTKVQGGQGFVKNLDKEIKPIGNASLLEKAGKDKSELEPIKKFSTPSSKTKIFVEHDFAGLCRTHSFDQFLGRTFDLKSALIKTFPGNGSSEINFSFYSHSKTGFNQNQTILLDRLSLLLIQLLDNIPTYQQFVEKQSDQPLDRVSLVLKPSVADSIADKKPDGLSLGLIGESQCFKLIKEQLATIAPFDISVLILGESGTGKERLAQAIHKLSSRALKPIIKVNCAAIPATLIESELFGHERGAFTGAIDRRIGKFEQAIGGTIFLDEIGELTMDLQVKLLCVLQEKEIVRLGGNQVIKTDVRVIAATNQNLEKAIAEGRFRLDLYYRLNVFPITMPPLRDRKEDIPALSRYFVANLSKKMDRRAKDISEDALKALVAYDWPGNIRELENIIERSLVFNRGDIIEQIEAPQNQNTEKQTQQLSGRIKTIRELEKEHIISTLHYCNGKVSGVGGAAELLDMPANTLFARIKKLGILKDFE